MDMKIIDSMCLAGNVLKIIEFLKTQKQQSKESVILEKQYEDRFINKNEINKINTDDPWIKAVINCYFTYFRSVLTNHPIEESENKLAEGLSGLTGGDPVSGLDEIESRLKEIFQQKGYSFLGGVTPPYRGPYIWKKTVKQEFSVVLPDSEQNMTVYFISDFLMLSWIHFATMGRHCAGGWAEPEGLYYVVRENESVDTGSDKFQIWFLKHEAQHLSDYARHPRLNAANLEYRAKLVELIYSPQPHKLIEKFLNQSKNDNTLPHPYAAYTIITNLSDLLFGQKYIDTMQQWRNIPSGSLSESALKLFRQNTKSLNEAGHETEGVI